MGAHRYSTRIPGDNGNSRHPAGWNTSDASSRHRVFPAKVRTSGVMRPLFNAIEIKLVLLSATPFNHL